MTVRWLLAVFGVLGVITTHALASRVITLIVRVIEHSRQANQARNAHIDLPGADRTYRTSFAEHEKACTTIQNEDPQFNNADFLNRFASAFHQIQDAWQGRDMRPVRHFVSDAIFERFTLQIQEQQDMNYRDHMEQIRIRENRTSARAPQRGDVSLTVHETFLEALCCVMVADGKVTDAEKRAIADLALPAGVPQSPEEIDKSIAEFVARVKDVGLRRVLDRCVELVERCCTQSANKKAFRRAFKIVAEADDSVHQRETIVIQRLQAACDAKT